MCDLRWHVFDSIAAYWQLGPDITQIIAECLRRFSTTRPCSQNSSSGNLSIWFWARYREIMLTLLSGGSLRSCRMCTIDGDLTSRGGRSVPRNGGGRNGSEGIVTERVKGRFRGTYSAVGAVLRSCSTTSDARSATEGGIRVRGVPINPELLRQRVSTQSQSS